jgi:class 3 adenylate cyclase
VAPQLFFLDRQSDHTVPQLRRKRLTVFFSDLQGFTHLMDRGDETVVAAFLNEYFETVYRVSEVYGGTLDKFLGDGVMVFFGDPGSDGPVADAYACVSMALDMRNRVVRLVERWQHETGIAYPGVRMGIHTGYCLVGSLGCQQRRDYTALGGTVNIASRLEGEAAPDEIIMSEDTRRLIRPWVFTRDLGDRRLRGVSQPIRVHAVQGVAHRGNGRYLASSIQLLK